MIVDFMGRISSVEFMARLDDYYENIRPYFHLLTIHYVLYQKEIVDMKSLFVHRFLHLVCLYCVEWYAFAICE